MSKTKIAIFISGSGTNAENITKYFANHPSIEVTLIVSSSPIAYGLVRAKQLGIPSLTLTKEFIKSDEFVDVLNTFGIDWIILAGFLWKIPANLLTAFPKKMLNIHPSLLPKYGGKGMYGSNVHNAVKENHEPQTGITIHYVNEFYDDGEIVCQETVSLTGEESVDEIAQKVHALEYKHFPITIEKEITKG